MQTKEFNVDLYKNPGLNKEQFEEVMIASILSIAQSSISTSLICLSIPGSIDKTLFIEPIFLIC